MRGNKGGKNALKHLLPGLVALLLSVAAATTAFAYEPLGTPSRISVTGPENDPNWDAETPSIAYNSRDNQHLAVWRADDLGVDGEYEVFAQRLDATGAPIGEALRVSTVGPEGNNAFGPFARPRVAYNSVANEFLVVWNSDSVTDGVFKAWGQRVSAAGTEIGSDFQISVNDASTPDIAYSAADDLYLVTWIEQTATAGKVEIFGRRISGNGTFPGSVFQISQTGAAGDADRDAFTPAVTAGPPGEYLVVFDADGGMVDNDREIWGQRINASGNAIGGDFRISSVGAEGDPGPPQANRPAVDFNAAAGRYLVTWEPVDFVTPDFGISGQLLGPLGEEVGGDFPISTRRTAGNRVATQPAVAANPGGGEFLVTWAGQKLAGGSDDQIFSRSVAVTGALGVERQVSATPTASSLDSGTPDPVFNPAANEYLVTWQANVAVYGDFEIFDRRLGIVPPVDPPVPPAPPTARCGGKQATKVGTAGRDVIRGTGKRDVIAGSGGNDAIKGLGGNDLICGGAGKDRIAGGAGKDDLRGDAGSDSLQGEGGKDRLNGGPGKDKLAGGAAKDVCVGGAARDIASACEQRKSIR